MLLNMDHATTTRDIAPRNPSTSLFRVNHGRQSRKAASIDPGAAAHRCISDLELRVSGSLNLSLQSKTR